MTIRSEKFDDIYFSPENGLAESRYVFLQSNDLPQGWQKKPRFVIGETGFGTGLNFLATWQLFEETAAPDQILDYISFEKYPLAPEQIKEALSPWGEELGEKLTALLNAYPLRLPGFHRLVLSDRIRLTLIIGDVNEWLPALVVPEGVDCWYLDGFAPAKNPAMWQPEIFAEMARLSHQDTRFATFTAAGAVRRGLIAAGFDVEKQPGFGRKREMLVGRYGGSGSEKAGNRQKSPARKSASARVAIIGGGLAGSAVAYVLKQCGLSPVIYDKQVGQEEEKSALWYGMVNPRFYAEYDAEASYYMSGYAQAVRTLAGLEGVGWEACGTLHLITDEDKKARFRALTEGGRWPEAHQHMLSAKEASQVAGVSLDHEALYLPDAGRVEVRALCRTLRQGVDIRHEEVKAISRSEKRDGWQIGDEFYDIVIMACAAGVTQFDALSWLPVRPVRGQITYATAGQKSAGLKTNLSYGGYLMPAVAGQHVMGSTFQRGITDLSLREEDNRYNLKNLAALCPALAEEISLVGAEAGLRSSAKDRFPLVGAMPDKKLWEEGGEGYLDGLYLTVAHGSHGIVSAFAGAHYLADLVTGGVQSLPASSQEALSPIRFLKRLRRRGRL